MEAIDARNCSCFAFDSETSEVVDRKTCGTGVSIYIPSMEPTA